MFGIINYGGFIGASLLLNITPGSDTIYILGNSLNGRKSGIMSALGICSGCMVHTVLAAFGLSAILAKSALVFHIIKYLGAAYLIYLGLSHIISKTSILLHSTMGEQASHKKVYLQGVITNSLNPKVALFFLAFLPQFISSENKYGSIPFLLLGFTFIFTSTMWYLVLAVFSSHITGMVTQKMGLTKILNKVTGSIFIILGLNLIRTKMET